ncbi:riboflavin synthase [Gottschalkiaceae bacterium SANA]|nr:riboflavin synthase [Gottschalkiaceae bacterium SANA]
MFTGIIQEIGKLERIENKQNGVRLWIQAPMMKAISQMGDSIATNGVCLTVSAFSDQGFCADVMPETMRRTAFSTLKPGASLNLEPALRLQDRLGGHMVSGHVDSIGKILTMRPEGNAVLLEVSIDELAGRMLIEKGSITMQGISLTIASCTATSFWVSLVGHTRTETTLGSVKIGDLVNLETDMIGKYIFQFTNQGALEPKMNWGAFLQKA